MTPDVIGVILAIVVAAGVIFGGLSAMLNRQMSRIDARFERVDQQFEKVDEQLNDLRSKLNDLHVTVARIDERLVHVEAAVAPPRFLLGR